MPEPVYRTYVRAIAEASEKVLCPEIKFLHKEGCGPGQIRENRSPSFQNGSVFLTCSIFSQTSVWVDTSSAWAT